MKLEDFPPELLDHSLRAADTALLTALSRHVCAGNAEVAKAIFNDAIALLSNEKAFEGEETAARISRHMLSNKLEVLLDEIQPKSKLGGGFQRTVE